MVQSLSPGGGDVRVDSLSGFLDVVPEAEGIPANDEDLDNVISENSVTLADPGVDPSLPLCISVADEDVKKQANHAVPGVPVQAVDRTGDLVKQAALEVDNPPVIETTLMNDYAGTMDDYAGTSHVQEERHNPVSNGIPGRSSYLITSLTCLYPHGIETVRSDILYWYSDW